MLLPHQQSHGHVAICINRMLTCSAPGLSVIKTWFVKGKSSERWWLEYKPLWNVPIVTVWIQMLAVHKAAEEVGHCPRLGSWSGFIDWSCIQLINFILPWSLVYIPFAVNLLPSGLFCERIQVLYGSKIVFIIGF